MDKALQELPEEGEKRRVMQAPNRAEVWSRSQQPREKAMVGPRFEQTIMLDQVGFSQNVNGRKGEKLMLWWCSLGHWRLSSSFTSNLFAGKRVEPRLVTAVVVHSATPGYILMSTGLRSAGAHTVVCHL